MKKKLLKNYYTPHFKITMEAFVDVETVILGPILNRMYSIDKQII